MFLNNKLTNTVVRHRNDGKYLRDSLTSFGKAADRVIG
jgi:hypothetical protein